MTPAQFDCCTTKGASATKEAARLVIIDGMRPSDAARQTGVSAQSVCDAVTRIRTHDAKIRAAYLPAHPTL